jgi:hypothetical protein
MFGGQEQLRPPRASAAPKDGVDLRRRADFLFRQDKRRRDLRASLSTRGNTPRSTRQVSSGNPEPRLSITTEREGASLSAPRPSARRADRRSGAPARWPRRRSPLPT